MIQSNVFRPVEGALMDLESLQAIAAVPDVFLSTWLRVAWPGASGLILEGLELEGEWATNGPPGTRRPDSKSLEARVTPGVALMTGRNGRKYLIEVSEGLQVNWPTQAGSAVQGVLVLVPTVQAGGGKKGRGVVVAREQVTAKVGFVKPDKATQPFLLPLAASIGNGRDWATDLARTWQPDHPALTVLLKRFETLERTVWRAEPEGSVWDRQVLGRNWVRYQTVAASAIQAGRIVLQSRATTTIDRVRLLDGLFSQLHGSVERAATELLQFMGPPEGAGPYAQVGASTLGGAA